MELYTSYFRLNHAPHGLSAAGFIQLRQHIGVGGKLHLVGANHGQVQRAEVGPAHAHALLANVAQIDQQRFLPAREGDVHIGEQLGVQQRAVQGAPAVVHAQPVRLLLSIS